MNSLTDLGEVVDVVIDVVIGVDTHVHTHSAAAIDAATGGVLGEITVDATAEGYTQFVEFAGEHATVPGSAATWETARGDRGRARPTQKGLFVLAVG